MSVEEASRIAVSLAELLSKEAVDVLTKFGHPNMFSEAQRDLLLAVTEFFTGTVRDDPAGLRQLASPAPTGTGDSDSDAEGSTAEPNLTSRKRKRALAEEADAESGGGKKKKTQGAMGRLTKFTNLNPEFKSFRNQYQHDIPAFFTDATYEDEPRGEGIKACVENRIVHEYLTYLIEYTDGIASRQTLDPARKAFTWLNCYDIVMHLNKKTRHKWTGGRMGHKLRDEIDRLLFNGVEVDDKEHTLDQFFMCCKRGLRIKALGERFGLGCIFYFAECLSDDFVDNKLHVTGPQSERVFEQLDQQGFREEVASSGMTEWAEGIRAYCEQALA